ncbi:Ig-like domain repeat protein, partial [Turicibacter sanguinis]
MEKNTEIRNIPNNNEWKVLNLTEPTLTKYVMIHAISTHGARPNDFITGKILNFFEDTTKDIEPVVNVTYSTETLTNQDVTATIQLPQGYTVVGEATHIFTQNGTHTFTYQSPTGKQYTHTITVDWIDKVAPTATISYSTTSKTNQSVTATLNLQEENITVENNQTSHVFDSNGEYTFIIRDQAGNTTEVKAEVTWINKETPVLDITYSTEEETDQPVIATLVTEEVQVASMNGKVITVTNNNGNKEYIFTDNGEFTFEYVDDYGNTGSTTAKVDWIVKTPDVEATDIKVTYSTETLTNQDVTATIQLPEGYTMVGEATHTFTQNGTHTFIYQSSHGTQYTYTITVDWIDKVAPTATVEYSTTNKTNQSVTATLNIQEENIIVENNQTSHVFDSNGEYTFIIRDQAGNTTEVKAEVTWINKETPVLD